MITRKRHKPAKPQKTNDTAVSCTLNNICRHCSTDDPSCLSMSPRDIPIKIFVINDVIINNRNLHRRRSLLSPLVMDTMNSIHCLCNLVFRSAFHWNGTKSTYLSTWTPVAVLLKDNIRRITTTLSWYLLNTDKDHQKQYPLVQFISNLRYYSKYAWVISKSHGCRTYHDSKFVISS